MYHFIIVLSRGTDRLERDTVLGSWGSGSPMRNQNSCCHYAEAAILALQTRGFRERIFTGFPGPLMMGIHIFFNILTLVFLELNATT